VIVHEDVYVHAITFYLSVMGDPTGLGIAGEDVLRLYGKLDVLPYYGEIAKRLLVKFLHGRELATRIWVPGDSRLRSVVIRGSSTEPLYIRQLAGAVTQELIEARKKYRSLSDARHELSPEQQLVWSYFPQRRYISLYHATNMEGTDRELHRAVFRIEPCIGATFREALTVTATLADMISSDREYPRFFRRDPFVWWTGASFCLMLFTIVPQPASFYPMYLEHTGKGKTITDRWVDKVSKCTPVKVAGGRQRRKGFVLIDPAATPSGNLCEVPIGCLHMAETGSLDGVSVPLTPEMIKKDIMADLLSYTPGRLIAELNKFEKRLPE